MKDNQNDRRRCPLILVPQLPLFWTSIWLGLVAEWRLIGTMPAMGMDVRESVLLVMALVLAGNIYNLIILYRWLAGRRPVDAYHPLALAYALTIIVSTVIAWGWPTTVLVPNRLNAGIYLFLLLNYVQASLGICFALQNRPVHGRASLLSLWRAPAYLVLTAVFLPPFLLVRGRARYGTLLVGLAMLLMLLVAQWRTLPQFFTPVPARQSGGYQLLIGINLAATMLSFLLGLDTLILRWTGGQLAMVSGCLTTCLLLVGTTTAVIAALQRYRLKYEYGAARHHQRRFVLAGAALLVLALLAGSLFFS